MNRKIISKRFLILFICIITMTTVIIILNALIIQRKPKPIISTQDIFVGSGDQNFITNNSQNESYTHLFAHNGKLYFYSLKSVTTEYAGMLSVFDQQKIEIIHDFGYNDYLGFAKGYFYYAKQNDIYCFSLDTNEHTFLISTKFFHRNDVRMSEKGEIFIPKDPDANNYYVFDKETLIAEVSSETISCLGDRKYVVSGMNNEDLICVLYGNQYDMENLIPYGYKTLLSYQNGLLVHNEGQGDILYFIDETGNVRELFSVSCMVSRSAINYYGGYVFLSVLRYEGHGDFGLLRYEDDNLSGTYRIDVTSGQTTKVSDKVFLGLYVLGDNALYAVDENEQIYLLDINGNCLQEILMFE